MNNKSNIQQGGFSLLEILIAFSILAFSLGILLNIFSGGLRRTLVAEEYQQAVTIAQSILSKVGIEEELQEGEKQGEIQEKYLWTQNIQAFGDEELDPEEMSIIPYQVTVTVEWHAGTNNRQVELITLRLSGKNDEI
ncbi:MAG: prepilin-type N-terminal cleavage/methylation domain-containing protein [Methylococcaceae bacterium]